MSDGASNMSQKQLEKLQKKAKEMGYSNLAFFVDDIDMLLRPANLLKQKDMKYFELENLISLLNSKNVSLGMAPRMISMVSKYSERNEELETENASLKQSNITMRSKYQTAEAHVKELSKQLSDLSVGSKTDAKIREQNIKLTEENKYLKMTNDSLTGDLKKTKEKFDKKLDEANNLEVENNQLELRVKDLKRELKEVSLEYEEEKKKGSGEDQTKKKIEELIEELDELYGTIDDPFKKEFLAFMGVELSEIVDDRHITKQKILNQISIHAREIEKIFEPQIAALKRAPVTVSPITTTPETRAPMKTEKVKEPEEKDIIPEPIKRKAPEPVETPAVDDLDILDENDVGDRFVKPSEFLKGKSAHAETVKDKEAAAEDGDFELTEEAVIPKPKPVSYPKKKRKSKKGAPVDRTPSPELIKVFDVFIKYLEAITDNNSYNDICDKIIEQLYEHVGSPGMTKVYKIKSGGVRRKQMLVDLLTKWKAKLPEM